MNNLYYRLIKQSQREKLNINKKTLLKIKKLYEEEGKRLTDKLKTANEIDKKYINSYMKYVDKELKELGKQIEKLTKDGITDTSQLMTNINANLFSYINNKYDLGIDPDILESLYKPNLNVINKIIDGNLYNDNRSLSKRIWGYNKNNFNKIQDILTDGMINKKPLQDVVSNLKAYTGGGDTKVEAIKRTYGQMNSNALRLARTSLNHAFIETMKDECRYNPFIEGYKWIMSGAHSSRMPNGDICDDYSSHDEGIGIGVFKKNNIPIPHPNCMCVIIPYSEKPLETIGEEIGKWIKGEPNKGIDAWVESRGYIKENKKEEKNSNSSVPKNKNGKEIKFNISSAKERIQERIKSTITQLCNEYETNLVSVDLEASKKGVKGSVDMAGQMHLSATKKSTIVHEFAHSIASTSRDKLGLSDDKEFWKEIRKIRTEHNKAIKNGTNKKISDYSLENLDEYFAEAFAHSYLKGTKDLSWEYSDDFEYSDKVKEIIDKYFKKKR